MRVGTELHSATSYGNRSFQSCPLHQRAQLQTCWEEEQCRSPCSSPSFPPFPKHGVKETSRARLQQGTGGGTDSETRPGPRDCDAPGSPAVPKPVLLQGQIQQHDEPQPCGGQCGNPRWRSTRRAGHPPDFSWVTPTWKRRCGKVGYRAQTARDWLFVRCEPFSTDK